MPETRSDFGISHDSSARSVLLSHRSINPSMVLVVSRSPINRVVVTRIAERCGLRALGAEPDAALALMEREGPATVILDGGGDNRDCDGLVPFISTLRTMPAGCPSVILLTTSNRMPENLYVEPIVDALVAKPITPEALQPTLLRLRERAAAQIG